MIWFILGAIGIAAFAIFAIKKTNRSNWHSSEKNNQTRIYKGSRITVFQSDGGWKYCISAPFGDDDPYYSDVYNTQQAAMESGVSLIDDVPSSHETKIEKREKRQLANSLEITSQSSSLLSDAKAQLLEMHQTGKFLVKDIEPILKTCKTQIRFMIDVYQSHYIEGRSDDADRIWKEREEFTSIEKHCDDLLIWLRSAPKNERGAPPSPTSII